MTRYLAAYAASAAVIVALDLLWLVIIAKPLYRQGIGHLMADEPKIAIAALFYLIYVFGLMIFAVAPYEAVTGIGKAVVAGALFGFIAYATYDLTNLATLKKWPVGLSLLDMAWGTFVSATAVAAGKSVLDRFAAS